VLAYRRTVLAVVSAAALSLSALVAAPAFADGPPVVPVVPAVPDTAKCSVLPLEGSTLPLCVTVDDKDGVKARVRVGDVLCVKVDALTSRTTVNERVILPCPIHYIPDFKDCAQAADAGFHDIPADSPLYRKRLDSDNDKIACETPPTSTSDSPPVAQAPEVVQAHLPVTH
jgi:Excalibur calcium-binding domain